jgi:hypothetical protein
VKTVLVLLQRPLGAKIHVRCGAASLEAATGLTSEQISNLDDDDRATLKKAMTR